VTADPPDTAGAGERLEALAGSLLSEDDFVTGKRRPPRLDPDDAVAMTRALGAQVDRGAAARDEAGAKSRLPVVCSRGCNGCCEEVVMVFLPDAISIARWLMEPEHHAARDAFLAAYPAWRKATGDGPARLADLFAKNDREAFLAEHQAQWGKRVLCAFNLGGDCAIYPVRPIPCRNAHAVETHERCSGANLGGKPAARLAFEPLDDYLKHADLILRAAHHALGGERRRAQSVCEAVHRQLQSLMAAQRRQK
jgi:Fe-S-cluster containining protein